MMAEFRSRPYFRFQNSAMFAGELPEAFELAYGLGLFPVLLLLLVAFVFPCNELGLSVRVLKFKSLLGKWKHNDLTCFPALLLLLIKIPMFIFLLSFLTHILAYDIKRYD